MTRKDNRGRVLKTGENQRKNLTYEYRYKDPVTGKRVSIYKNTLQELRDEEKKIQRMLDEQMDTLQGNRLLEDQLDLYLKTKHRGIVAYLPPYILFQLCGGRHAT